MPPHLDLDHIRRQTLPPQKSTQLDPKPRVEVPKAIVSCPTTIHGFPKVYENQRFSRPSKSVNSTGEDQCFPSCQFVLLRWYFSALPVPCSQVQKSQTFFYIMLRVCVFFLMKINREYQKDLVSLLIYFLVGMQQIGMRRRLTKRCPRHMKTFGGVFVIFVSPFVKTPHSQWLVNCQAVGRTAVMSLHVTRPHLRFSQRPPPAT